MASYRLLCYINSDVILLSHFLKAVQRIEKALADPTNLILTCKTMIRNHQCGVRPSRILETFDEKELNNI
jgi:hypothetical protein